MEEALAEQSGVAFDHADDLGMGKGKPPAGGRVGAREEVT